MTKARIFPCILIALYICAAGVYASQRDWRRTLYWLAAAVLNATVTFWAPNWGNLKYALRPIQPILGVMVNTEIDISAAVDASKAVLKKLPFTTNDALTAIGKEIVTAEREALKSEFTVRKQFILNRVKILQYSRATNLTMIVGIDPNVQGGKLLLGAFEQGGEKDPQLGSELAVPITGEAARPTFAQSIPRSLLYKALQIQQIVTARGLTQWKGKKRTFVIPNVGVFQRFGPGKHDIELIYKFETHAPLPQRMHFVQTAVELFEKRFKQLWNEAFAKEITHGIRWMRSVPSHRRVPSAWRL